jgi:hypothetical protein
LRAKLFLALTIGSPLVVFAGLMVDAVGRRGIGVGLLVLGVAGIVGGRLLAVRWKRQSGQPVAMSPLTEPTSVAAVDVPAGNALDVPETWSYERSQRRIYRGMWVFGLAALIGFVAVASEAEGHEQNLVDHGGQVTGVVSGYDAPPGAIHLDDDDRLLVDYTAEGVSYTGHVQLDDNSATYNVGQTVTVYYDKSNPADMTIPGQDNQPAWSVALFALLLVLGLLLLFVGVQGARRARLRRSILSVAGWQAATSSTVDGSHMTVDGRVLRAVAAKGSLARIFVPGPVWLAPVPDSLRVVIAPVGGRRCVLAKAPDQPA